MHQLKREKARLPHGSTKTIEELHKDLTHVTNIMESHEPWVACWPEGRSMATLTTFMTIATRANCPLMVSFLRWAGAWPFFSVGSRGTTPLHAAIQGKHFSLVRAMVRDLGASLYIPDTRGCLPRDMEQLPSGLRTQLEEVRQAWLAGMWRHTAAAGKGSFPTLDLPSQILLPKMSATNGQLTIILSLPQQLMYKQECADLEALKERQKDMTEKKKIEAMMALQETLFKQYREGQAATAEDVVKAGGVQALLVASRRGLLQMLHLVLAVGGLPPNTVLDPVCGTTALHEAAAHGKSGCVAHLLHALQTAATANGNTMAAIAAAATDMRPWQLDRYSPLQPDRYGQTALHLAAMFGYGHTLELLQRSVREDPPCRAGTTAQEVRDNFDEYLRRYLHCNDSLDKAASLPTLGDPEETLKMLLHSKKLHKLPCNAQHVKVDFSDKEGEAAQVRQAVLHAVGLVVGRAAYMSQRQVRLQLVGSSQDGSKLFAPDEFDINVMVAARDCVRVTVQEAEPLQGHPYMLGVETEAPELRGLGLAQGLQQAVGQALSGAILNEPRLSVVPPGLTPTQVGVALSLAWQGEQYPLLLVSVDLVPVLEVDWHQDIERPPLTPPGTTTMHLSATRDGSWRCSFAQLESEVLASMTPGQQLVQRCAKLLLASLKAERWMPQRVKARSTWWFGRAWRLPVPSSFCLKSCLFRRLERWREEGQAWGENDAMVGLMEVLEEMCRDKATGTLGPRHTKAYFGGDFERPKDSSFAYPILQHLQRTASLHQRSLISLTTLRRWWWQMARLQRRLQQWRAGLWCRLQQWRAGYSSYG